MHAGSDFNTPGAPKPLKWSVVKGFMKLFEHLLKNDGFKFFQIQNDEKNIANLSGGVPASQTPVLI